MVSIFYVLLGDSQMSGMCRGWGESPIHGMHRWCRQLHGAALSAIFHHVSLPVVITINTHAANLFRNVY